MWPLKGILSPEQEADGFAAFEDEHFVYLVRWNEVCAVFSSSGATKESIREAAESLRDPQGPTPSACEGRDGQ